MARKPTISPSKLTTYLACAFKYRWTYVDDRGRFYLRARRYYSFGSSLHRVLQRFHDSGDQGVKTTHEALVALEENWITAGYSSAQEMQEALGEGREILTAYVEHEELRRREPTTAETLFVERQLRMDMGQFDLIGRLDRVDKRSDGTIEVIDYKSGRADVSSEQVADDLAMGCYQLLLANAFPGEPVCATILALRTGARASYAMPEAEREDLKQLVTALGEEILARDFHDDEPTWKVLCPECDFLELCSRYPNFESERIANS